MNYWKDIMYVESGPVRNFEVRSLSEEEEPVCHSMIAIWNDPEGCDITGEIEKYHLSVSLLSFIALRELAIKYECFELRIIQLLQTLINAWIKKNTGILFQDGDAIKDREMSGPGFIENLDPNDKQYTFTVS